jgi:O-antigen/teichoic acid export membrane protein
MVNKFILLLEKAYSPAFNMLITVAAARIYGAEVVGNLALILAFSALGQYLSSRGTDQNMQVAFASCPIENLTEATVAEVRKRLMRLFFSVPAIAVLYSSSSLILIDTAALFFGLFGAALGAMSACATPNEVRLTVIQNFRLLVTLKYASGTLAVLLGLLILSHYPPGTMVLIATLIIERAIYLVLTIVTSILPPHVTHVSLKTHDIPRINIHVLISAVAIFGYNRLDQVYIYGVFSSQELGVYFSTLKLFEVANLLIMAAISGQLHIMADLRRESFIAALIEKRLLALSCIFIGLIAIITPQILSFVFDIRQESYAYIYMLAAGTLFGTIGAIKGPWVAKNNRFHFNTYFTIAGSIVAILFFTFCEPANLLSVAIANALGQFTVNVLCPLMLKSEREYLLSLIAWRKK